MLNTMKDFLEQHIDDEEVKQKIEELVSSSDDDVDVLDRELSDEN